MESSIITTRFPSTADRTAPRLEPDRLLPKILRRLDEGTAHIPVFDKAEPVRDSRRPGIAHSRLQPGIGHSDHHVGVPRLFLCEQPAGTQPGFLHAAAMDHAVCTGEIDEFEHAQLAGMDGGGAGTRNPMYRRAFCVHTDKLAWF